MAAVIPVAGAAPTNSVALGAGLALLAFAATRVSRQFDPFRRPAAAQFVARLGRACQRRVRRLGGFAPAGKARFRKRAGVALASVPAGLADERADEQQPTQEPRQPSAEDIFWPPKRSAGSSHGGYQSKHRLPGHARPLLRERRAPRHAAPPAR